MSRKVLFLVGALLCGVAGWFASPRLPTSPLAPEGPSSAAPAPKAEISRDAISTLGRLVPRGGILDISAADGLVERVLVKESQQVKAGEALAYLQRHDTISAELAHARARVEEAKEQIVVETNLGLSRIAEAQAKLDRLSLGQLEVERAESVRDASKVVLDSAQEQLKRFLALHKENAAREQEVSDARNAFSSAQETYRQAEISLKILKRQTEFDVTAAKANLEVTKANLEVGKASVPLSSLEQQVLLLERRLEASVVRSPRDGQVLKLLAQPGEVLGRRSLLKLGDTSQMYAIAEVYQTDIRYLKPGQKATITNAALPGELTGVVEEVGLLIFKSDVFGDDPTAAINARVFQVLVRLDPSDFAARFNNLEANVVIEIGPRESGPEPEATKVPK